MQFLAILEEIKCEFIIITSGKPQQSPAVIDSSETKILIVQWSRRLNTNMSESRAEVSQQHGTNEQHSLTWLLHPVRLIKNLLEESSAFLM